RARFGNLALLALALCALAFAVWSGRALTSDGDLHRHSLLPQFRPEEVQRLEVWRGGRRSVIVRRPHPAAPPNPAHQATDDPDEGDWSLSEPFETDAEDPPVEKLLGSLRYATWERAVPGPLSPAADAGAASAILSERALVIQMGKLTYRLRLGGPSVSPPGSQYVEVDVSGSAPRVYVIKQGLVDDLFVDADVFRGRQIVPYRKSSIARVVLSSAAGARRLRRVGDTFHFEEMQDGQRARRAEVDRIFMALARASADPILDLEVAKTALAADSSLLVAVLPTATDKPEASFSFGGTCPTDPTKTVAVRHLPEPLAGCVDRSVLYALREPASSLIDSTLFSLHADEVDTVQITEGDQVLEFARSADGFTLRQPRSAELDAEAAKDRLSRILNIDGDLLPARERPHGAAEFSAAIVTLESSARPGEERVKETVRVSSPRADGSRLVYRQDDGAVVVIPHDAALALHADATLLKDHRVFDYPISQVRGLDIKRGTVKQTLRRSAAGALTLLEPKGYDIDGGLAVNLIDELRTLHAVRWVTDGPTTGFGLDKPRVSVRFDVEVDGQPISRTLTLGRSAPGGFYASVDRDPGVFVAPRSVDRALGMLLLDRSLFSADRNAIVELNIAAGDRAHLSLKRVAGELTVQKGSSAFDPARIDELLDAVSSLRPEAAVHVGPPGPGEGLRKPVLTVFIRRLSPASVGLPPIRFSVGSRDSFDDASIYYARPATGNATYALPRAQVERILDLF
ncbi:MAG TPA: DUF4340 domain-containing protein, partial [Polyangiaceae bacterium]|nr:DUF4340 domain-containing protein [Polyangiaceae bacterium]